MPNTIINEAREGNFDKVKALLDSGVSVNKANEGLATALHMASMYCHIEIVKLLIEKKVCVDALTDQKQTALHWVSSSGCATEEKRIAIVDLLLAAGAKHNKADKNGFTPANYANSAKFFILEKKLTSINNQKLVPAPLFTRPKANPTHEYIVIQTQSRPTVIKKNLAGSYLSSSVNNGSRNLDLEILAETASKKPKLDKANNHHCFFNKLIIDCPDAKAFVNKANPVPK